MAKPWLALLAACCGLALAQTPSWPPKVESGQTWSFVLEASGQRFIWNVKIGAVVRGNIYAATAEGVDRRTAQVAYFADTLPGTNYKDVLVFDFQAPSVSSSFTQPFACIIFNNGRGNIPLAPGAVCSATLGAATGPTTPSSAEAPAWLREARRVPAAGQSWRLEAFNVVWGLNFAKAEGDGLSGTARILENRSGDQLPPDWNLRLTYAGRTARLEISAGQATIACVLDDQFQNAVNGVLRADANLFRQGVQGSQAQSTCRVVLNP
ncbi:MAG: hypothetical protein SFU83_15470 [Meiothermus sp.]|nr:hypothetical protein [Meiothermus sp.]